MGQVFHRFSGRGWRLRQRSLELWREWIEALKAQGHSIPYRQGLLLLASDGQELERQGRLSQERQAKGFPLELWEPAQLQNLQPPFPRPSAASIRLPMASSTPPWPWQPCAPMPSIMGWSAMPRSHGRGTAPRPVAGATPRW